MPTPISVILGGAASSGPRRETYVLTASNASLPIPAWAQGGKGIVYVTGCGGGGSGSISATTNTRGKGGDSSGYCARHPIVIPSGASTCNAQIGAGATGVTGTAATNGGAGGETTLTIGSVILRLEGGAGEGAAVAGSRRLAYMGAQLPVGQTVTGTSATGFGAYNTANAPAALGLYFGGAASLCSGAIGGDGASANGGFGAGGQSPFGAGGAGLGAAPAVNTNGGNAAGYGAGGAGALWQSGGAVTSGAGAPGLLILEFVEGV